jgi:quercetin dioxygenase-like cupin family protein
MWVRRVLPCYQAAAATAAPSPVRPSKARREGFEVIHGGQKPDFTEDMHAHDFDVRIMVLGGEITVTRDGNPETFRAGGHCELPEGCQHTTKVGPEGVALIVGKAYRRAAAA